MPVYVHQALLESIPDLFCAETLWQAPGFALFSRRPLLRDLLERCPREQRGRAPTRCFAHVIVTLPQEDIDDDYHLARGARARELEQALAALHQRDFADLLGGDTVRYRVEGSDDLPPATVAVRFGHAVYLPAPGEKIAFSASVSRDGSAWKPVCPVYTGQRLALLGADAGSATELGHHGGHGTATDAGHHAASGMAGAPSHALPGRDGVILLLNDGPGAQPIVQVRPRDAYECRFDAAQGHYVIRARHPDAQGMPAGLLLRIATSAVARPANGDAPAHGTVVQAAGGTVPDGAGPGAARPQAERGAHAVWQPRHASAAPAPSVADAGHVAPLASAAPAANAAGSAAGIPPTISPAISPAIAAAMSPPSATEPWAMRQQPPGRQQRGFATYDAAPPDDATALPQPMRRPAAAAQGEATDATYVPVARQRVTLAALALPRLSRYRDTGAQRLDIPLGAGGGDGVALAIDADDGLHAISAGGRHAVATPATLPQPGGRAIHVLPPPSPMADRYCALLPLPQPASVQLPLAGRHCFGRQSAALAPLRMLDSPRLLHCAGASASADRIGLSREAFSFEMTPQGVRIARLAPSQALYHLDGQLQFVASIGAASEDAPYLLPPGHHVAAGHYVLRFDA